MWTLEMGAGVLINPHVYVYCIWKLASAIASGVVGGAESLENGDVRVIQLPRWYAKDGS